MQTLTKLEQNHCMCKAHQTRSFGQPLFWALLLHSWSVSSKITAGRTSNSPQDAQDYEEGEECHAKGLHVEN